MKNFIENYFHTAQYDEFRRRCIEACNVSSATWSNWKNGVVVPGAKYRAIIDTIATDMFGHAIFSAQSGEIQTNNP